MRVLAVLLLLAACGDSGHEAPSVDAAEVDAPPAVDAPAATCDYVEQHDATNDDVSPATGTAEDTGIVVDRRRVICGAFDHTHFDGDITVDIDGYHLTMPAEGDVLVRISGAGAEAIELVGVDVYGGPAFDQHVGAVTFYGDHGVAELHLAAGTYEVLPFALAQAALTATVPYELEIAPDAPATRCAPLTTGGYAEALDGPASAGNDVVAFPSGAPTKLTTATTDAPEPTAIDLAPGATARITGSAADVAVADRYEDKDTFAFTTAASTNEVAVRLGWTGAANLDAYLFEAGNPDPVGLALTTVAGEERTTFSTKPGTAYWLLVGAKPGAGLPASYAATLCGAAFAR